MLGAPDEPHRPDPVPVPEPPPVPGQPRSQTRASSGSLTVPAAASASPSPRSAAAIPPAPTPKPPFPRLRRLRRRSRSLGRPQCHRFPPPPAPHSAYDFQRPVSHVPTQAPPVSIHRLSRRSPLRFPTRPALRRARTGPFTEDVRSWAPGRQPGKLRGSPFRDPAIRPSYPTRGMCPGYPGNSSPQPQPAAEGPRWR